MSIVSSIIRRIKGSGDGGYKNILRPSPVPIPVEATNRRYGRIKNSTVWHDFGGPSGTMGACGVSPSEIAERSHVILPEDLCKRCKKALAES